MIQDRSIIKIADNSGAKIGRVFKVLGSSKKRWATIGEVVILSVQKAEPIILLDGVFFQLHKNGVARVWQSLLETWANTELSKHIIVLDRDGNARRSNSRN